jgi:hypothetical protein
MKKALINKNISVESGWQICEVVATGDVFPVDETFLEWIDCDDNIDAFRWWYDNVNDVIKPVSKAINTIDITDTTMTINTEFDAHDLSNGAQITVSEQIPEAYNGTYIVTVIDTYNFSYTVTSNEGPVTQIGKYDVV